MTKIATLKMQAKNLRASLVSQGIAVTSAQSLESVAQQYGFSNWDTLAGKLKKKPELAAPGTLADLPDRPDSVWVEQGLRGTICRVVDFEEEGIALLDDEPALAAFLEEHAEQFDEGLDSYAMEVRGDGEDVYFTFRQLLGIQYCGGGTWKLADDETYLRFNCGGTWEPKQAAVELDVTVPELVKSAKGCQLVVLPSSDEGDWNHFVIVPPHLQGQVICDKISAEIGRLRQLDTELVDTDEYTDKDLASFVEQLGCLWVEKTFDTVCWD